MVANTWLIQFLADVCALPVLRPDYREMTALGAAAAMQLRRITPADWSARTVSGKRFEPTMPGDIRSRLINGWQGTLFRSL